MPPLYAYYRFGPAGKNFNRDAFEKEFVRKMNSYSFEEARLTKLKRLVDKQFSETTNLDRKAEHRLTAFLKTLEEEE